MRNITLFITTLLVSSHLLAASYVPQGLKTISSDTTIYCTDITEEGDPATSWVVVPSYGTGSKKYTNVNDDDKGNPTGITDNLPSTSENVAMIKIKADGNTYTSQKRVVIMHVKGITGVIGHGMTGSSGRGMAIGCDEYSASLTAPTQVAEVTRSGNGGSFILEKQGLDATKEYIISFYGIGGETTFYAAEFIAGGDPVPSNDATLKDLQVNGETVEGFAADKLSYSVVLEAGTTDVPEVTAVPNSNKATYEINNAESLPGTTTIVVTAENEEDTKEYSINFTVDDGFPTVTDIEFDNKKGEVEIIPAEFPEAGSIAAQIKYGSDLTAINITFKGKNIYSWSPNDAQDFSTESVEYLISASTGATVTYVVTITEADEVKARSISLNKTELPLKEGETAPLVATVLPEDADNKTVTWSTSDSTVATVENGIVTAIIAGTATITAKDAEGHEATCTVTVKGVEPLPETDLTTHTPDIYDEPDGYNTPLEKFGGREYEVYYTQKGKIGSSCAVVITKEGGDYITNSDQKAIDGWFETDAASYEDSGRTVQDEFKVSGGAWKMKENKSLTMHFKGFDCFRLYAKDANDTRSDRQFHVYIDDFDNEVPMEHSTSATIREFPISTGEHVIKLVAEGSSNMYLYGWSLRVTNDPLVRYISGNTDQTAFQTKDIQPVTFLVRRAKAKRLTWKDNIAIDSIQLVAGGGDTVRIQGKANAATGVYTYTLEALDENDEVASTETGTITIETLIKDNPRHDQTVNVAEEIKPINFIYYGINSADLTLTCDIDGLSLEFPNDSTCSLVGSPDAATQEGEYPYTISIAGGNSVSGTITINVPDPYFEQTEAKIRDDQQSSFTILAHHADEVTIVGLPEGLDYQYNRNTDQIIVSGTTHVGDPYPHIDTLILTATPRYDGKETVTAKGVLTIIAPDAKAVLLIHKDLESDRKDAVADCLYGLQYDLTLCQQDAIENTSLDAIDLIVISQNADANHEAILNLIRSDKKPMLNLNGFTYSSDRLGWGEPYNGTVNEDHKASLFVQRDDHPIFKDWKPQGKEVNLFETVPNKGIMPIKVDGTVTECMGSLCIATAYTRSITDYFEDGELQTEIHEIPLPKRLNKYICFPIASDVTLSDDGKKIIDRTAKYLLSEEPCIQRPGLQIMSFSLAGYAALPQEGEPGSIIIDMTKEEFRALDSLRSATPEITLMDPDHTFLMPTKPMDFRFANLVPVIYTVTDYINIHTYEVTIDVPYEQGIDEVYTSGEWVMIYDIYGRSVATTNEDIYSMTLPRGIYIVITENGNTIKLFK